MRVFKSRKGEFMQRKLWWRLALPLVLVGAAVIFAFGMVGHLRAQSTSAADKPYVIEYYYKVKWGHADEFITLFRKNHYPVLKKQVEMGRLLKVSAVTPSFHMTEDSRWDYRVTIVFKSVAALNDGFDEKALIKQMYPDQDTYKKEEQRRFEILDAHWDLPVKDVELETR